VILPLVPAALFESPRIDVCQGSPDAKIALSNDQVGEFHAALLEVSHLILHEGQVVTSKVLTKIASQPFGKTDGTEHLRINMSVRGVTLDTRLKLKIMAVSKGVPIYRLLDEIVDKAWQKEKDKTPEQPVSSRRISKGVGRILKKLAGA
jgi:hypothetical protein